MRTFRALIAVVVVLSFGAASVRAENNEDIRRARTHYQAGHALYKIGNYSDAIREFLIGYDLAPRPEFLLNIGQTYRKLGDIPRARAMYEKFLRETPPSDSRRPAVEKILSELPASAPEPSPSPSPQLNAPPPNPSPSPIAVTTTPAAPKKSFIRRHWWIIPVTIVAAAGLGVGLYFALRPSDPCAGGTLGCPTIP